ncbi:MAG: hypothetical protein M3552_15960 [Planctomycetota bacterium]|nr:hypothetical protein [Planctomycetota bacterium]
MKVVLRNPHASSEADYRHSLTVGSEYEVIGISYNSFRLINDKGEPILYEMQCFDVTDPVESPFWVSIVEHDDEEEVRYANPPGWGVPGFYEDWHDGVEIIRRVFDAQLAAWYPDVAKARRRTR